MGHQRWTGDMQARAENGEELSGVRPYTLEVDGDDEWVYVLQLEGAGFAEARKRWGFTRHPRGHPLTPTARAPTATRRSAAAAS
jgi:ribosomal protein L3